MTIPGVLVAGSVDRSNCVVDLQRVDSEDLAGCGAKAANLGALLRARFPVPPGFVVTTVAYDRVVSANHLQSAIAEVATRTDGAAARDGFAHVAIPPDVERAILAG